MSRPAVRPPIHHKDPYISDENTEDSENEENKEIVNQSISSKSFESGFSPDRNSFNNTRLSSSYTDQSEYQRIVTTTEESKIRKTATRSRTASPGQNNNLRIFQQEQNINQRHKKNSSESGNVPHYNFENADQYSEARASLIIGFWIIIVMFVIIIPSGLYYTGDSDNLNGNNNINGNKYITCDEFGYIENDFPNQQDYLWDALKIGIESVINRKPTLPSVYLLIHHKNYQPNNLVKRIVNATLSCLETNDLLTFESNIWQTEAAREDHGVIVHKYINGLKNGGILYIPEVNKIPGEGARALHFICDNISPIHERVVIFLTLPVEEYEGKNVDIAENELNKIWGSTLKPNELSALIARVTDQVLWLKSN